MRLATFLYGLALILVVGLGFGYVYGRSIWVPVYQKFNGKQTLEQVLERYGPAARARLLPYFRAQGIDYPPPAITLLAIKDRASLELWAQGADGPRQIRTYPIRGLSGHAGPKLREGDRQVPEGIYRILGFNPNSLYHLSMKLDYPNLFDRDRAAAEGRTRPGSNIFIHGKAVSIGCLAMGDRGIEELFVLSHDVGPANIGVAIAPSDPRQGALALDGGPPWVAELYRNLEAYFRSYRNGHGPEPSGAVAPALSGN